MSRTFQRGGGKGGFQFKGAPKFAKLQKIIWNVFLYKYIMVWEKIFRPKFYRCWCCPEKFFEYFFKKIVNPPLPSRSPIFLGKIGAPKLKFAPGCRIPLIGHVNGASDVSKVFNSLRLTARHIRGDWFRICCIREFKFPDTLYVFIFNTFRIYIFNTFRIYIFRGVRHGHMKRTRFRNHAISNLISWFLIWFLLISKRISVDL
jgi:hypothetical protein